MTQIANMYNLSQISQIVNSYCIEHYITFVSTYFKLSLDRSRRDLPADCFKIIIRFVNITEISVLRFKCMYRHQQAILQVNNIINLYCLIFHISRSLFNFFQKSKFSRYLKIEVLCLIMKKKNHFQSKVIIITFVYYIF